MFELSLKSTFGACCAALLVSLGCSQHSSEVAAGETLAVNVAVPTQRPVTDYVDFTGRTDAVQSVDIVPRVTGYLTKLAFKEGSEVKKGDVLFEIDPRPYQAQYDQGQGQVDAGRSPSSSVAKADNARAKAAAQDSRRHQPAGSRSLSSRRGRSRGRVTAAKASLEIYKLNLSSAKSIRQSTARSAAII